MKKIAFLIFISFNSIAQLPIDPTTQKFTYSGVIDVDGDKNELYMRARAWFVTMYKDADEVIQLEDKEAGKIIGKGRFEVVLETIPKGLNSGVKNLYQRTHEKALLLEASIQKHMQVKSTPEDW
jgi:hypothetical protein